MVPTLQESLLAPSSTTPLENPQFGAYSTHIGSHVNPAMTATSIADALFTRTQQRVLGLLYSNPQRSFYSNEIVRQAAMGRGTIYRELERLSTAGLLLATREGNQRRYRANPDNPIYADLIAIVQKTFGIVDLLRTALSPLDAHIQQAFVFGSIAKGEDNADSDIDLLVIADKLAYAELGEALTGAEQSLGRRINPSIYTAKQIRDKIKQKNAFITRVFEQPRLWVKGSENDRGKPQKAGQHQSTESRTS